MTATGKLQIITVIDAIRVLTVSKHVLSMPVIFKSIFAWRRKTSIDCL